LVLLEEEDLVPQEAIGQEHQDKQQCHCERSDASLVFREIASSLTPRDDISCSLNVTASLVEGICLSPKVPPIRHVVGADEGPKFFRRSTGRPIVIEH
jgi:hypothetical protein